MNSHEETEVHREPLNPKQIRGIDLVIKSVGKKYPYIVGWEMSSSFDKYHSQMFIDLIVDMNKLSNYYKKPIKSIWVELLTNTGHEEYNNGIYFLEGGDDIKEINTQNRKDIQNMINTTYELIPIEYQVKLKWSGHFFGNSDYQTISKIDVSDYFCKIF